jgi:arylsulfatase A-like enzyme/Tfp pilus assembly protein PilF
VIAAAKRYTRARDDRRRARIRLNRPRGRLSRRGSTVARTVAPNQNGVVKRVGLVLALAAVAGAGWVALARPRWAQAVLPARAPRNLLIVTLDTLRADHLGSYGYAAAQTPRLDALARSGLRFTQATTVVPLTLPAHSSLFTGAFPGWHGVRDNGGFYLGDDQVTLAEVLRERGFRTGAFVSAFVLDRRWGIGQGFERFHDEFDLDAFGDAPGLDSIQRPGSQTVDQAVAWLGADRERPFFAWVHLYDPHAPYEAPEPYRSRFPATMAGAYDAEIATTDAQVGRLLDALAVQDRLDDTLVVALADHGEMLGEHEEQAHGFFVYDAAVRIPLIVAGPGVPPRAVAEQVRIVDVMPTVLDLLGVAAPKSVQGVSLRPLARGGRLSLVARSESWYPRYHYGWSDLQSIQDGRFKYIRAPRPELYDLSADPRETNDLAREDPQRLAALEAALSAEIARTSSTTAPKGPQVVDAETEERLAALGYVGGSVSARHLEDRPRGDPKDKIGLYNLLKLAGTDSNDKRYDQAIARVDEVLSADPEVVEAHMLRGNFLKKSQRPDDAVEAYRRALALDPEHQGALFSLALAYKDQGRLEEARVGFERARALDPRNGKVLWQLADLALRQHQPERAEAIVQDALTRQVDAHRFLLKRAEGLIERQRYDEAEQALLQALEKKPDLPTAHYNLGLVYEARRQPERAIAAYEAELARSDKAYRAAFNLAKLLQAAGRSVEAVRRFRQAVDAQAGFGTGQLYLAKALLDTGDLAGAEAWARKGLESSPDPRIAPLGHFVLADVYNRQGRAADAEREIARARRRQKSAT